MWKGCDYTCFLCKEKSVYFCQEWPPKVTACPNCSGVSGLLAYDPETEACTYTKLSKD